MIGYQEKLFTLMQSMVLSVIVFEIIEHNSDILKKHDTGKIKKNIPNFFQISN